MEDSPTPVEPTSVEPTPAKPARRKIWWIAGAVAALIVIAAISNAGAKDKPSTPGAVTASSAAAAIQQGAQATPPAPEPEPEPTEEAEPDTFNLALNTTVTTTTQDGKANIRVARALWANPHCDYIDVKGKILQVTVVFNVLSGKESINPFDFTYVDPNGQASEHTYSCVKPELHSAELPKGGKRTGIIVFDVEGAKGGTIEYSPGFEVIASWKVP